MAESKADRTKQYIIEKASPIFNKKGYAGTSLNDLIEATGLTKGAIYGNFDNKDDVALATFDYNRMLVNKPLADIIRSKETALEKLLAIPAYYRKAYAMVAKFGGCPILNASTEADDNHPILKKKVSTAIKEWKKNIEKILTTGIENKEFKPDIDSSKTASVFISLIEGGIMMSKITGDRVHLDFSMDTLEEIIHHQLKR